MDYFIVRVLFLAVRGELNSWREDLGAKAFGFCLLKLERNYLWQNQRQRPYFLQRMWLRNTQMDGTVSRLSSVEYDDRGEGKSGV